jgi:hypothetical protein
LIGTTHRSHRLRNLLQPIGQVIKKVAKPAERNQSIKNSSRLITRRIKVGPQAKPKEGVVEWDCVAGFFGVFEHNARATWTRRDPQTTIVDVVDLHASLVFFIRISVLTRQHQIS